MKKVVGAFLCVLIIPLLAYAVVPLTANYQGYLTNAGGTPVNGTVTMTFTLYLAPSGGSPIWSETQSVSVDNGVYNVVLGAVNPLSLPFDSQYYLGVTVGADAEMTPRQALTSVPYAINADSAEVGYDLVCSGCVSLSELNFTPGDITCVIAGTGLTGGGTAGCLTISVDTSVIQSRVTGFCAAGSSIRTIYQNGTVLCEPDTDTNTTYSAGTGLDLVGTTFSVEEPLSLTGNHTGGVIRGTNNYATGYGIYGYASNAGTGTNMGGYFAAGSTNGRGVFGLAMGLSGIGVYGYANNTEASTNYGGSFEATGTNGRAVYGFANNTAATNYGGYFIANGITGRAVYGYANNPEAGSNYGGYFVANGTNGRAVYGYANNSGTSTNYGGYFMAYGTSGSGVLGYATGTNGLGVQGFGVGSSGIGVEGYGNAYDFYATGPGENYGSASSIRWKNNIVDIDNALDKVLSLRGVYFDWDEEHGGQHDMGFIAEEVGAVVPEIVAYEPDGVYATGVDYGAITPVLVQAIKEQQKLIDQQRKLIDAQQEQIDQLKTEMQILKERM